MNRTTSSGMPMESRLNPRELIAKAGQAGITRTLIFWFISLAFIPLLAMSWLDITQKQSTLYQHHVQIMRQHAFNQSQVINNWFEHRFADIKLISENHNTVQFFKSVQKLKKSRSQTLQQLVNSKKWRKLIKHHEPELAKFSETYGIFSNVFLIDVNGNVLFNLLKDDSIPLGSNIHQGIFKDSTLSTVCKQSSKTGKIQFSDLIQRTDQPKLVSGYLFSPVRTHLEKNLGVVVIEISSKQIDHLMTQPTDFQSPFTSYLVGEDFSLRSSIPGTKSQLLKTEIVTKQTKKWETHQHNLHVPYTTATEWEKEFEYKNHVGIPVFGLHRSLHLKNIRWALLVETDKKTIIDATNQFTKKALIMIFPVLFIVVLFTCYFLKRITLPLHQLLRATQKAAEGDFEQKLPELINNEIGQLARGFGQLLEARRSYEFMLEDNTNTIQKMLDDLAEQKFAMDQHALVTTTDTDGIINFVNDKFAATSGYSKEELLGENHRILNSGFHDKEFFAHMYSTLSKGEVWHGEIRNRAKDGKLFWVATTIVPFLGDNKKPRSYIAIRTDISDRKKAEQELTQARDTAEEATRLKSRFLASMSHEIRTPMNGVIGMLTLLLKSSLDKTQQHHATLARDSAHSLLSLINDILDFSKVEAGKLELESRDFDLCMEINNTILALAQNAQEKQLELILDTTQLEFTSVKGDSGRIKQILNNLISNAIKFTEKGEILVKASTYRDGERAVFNCSVSDTGIGIPNDKIPQLFESFTQVDASTTRRFGGTGLGLAIVKQLCKLMNGNIKASSRVGRGSQFEFWVELIRNNKGSPPSANLSSHNILLVAPNASNRQMLSSLLHSWGADVVQAGNTDLARQYLQGPSKRQRNHFCAIIDMTLDPTAVSELIDTIRRDGPEQSRIIIMKPIADQTSTIDGVDGIISKPVISNELVKAFDSLAPSKVDPLMGLPWKETTDTGSHNNPANPKQQNRRVLLVEDNNVNQLVAHGMLQEINLDCDIAANGVEALELLRNNSFEFPYLLVIMDCQMPLMDGYETTRQIRSGAAGENCKTIPIIAMTANTMKGDRETCIAAGMDDYIDKPVDVDTLHTVIDKWLCHVNEKSQALAAKQEKQSEKKNTDCNKVWDMDDALKRAGGKEINLQLLCKVFINDVSFQVESLRKSLQSEHYEEANALSHAIKGSSGNMGACKLQKSALKMEAACKENNRQLVQQLWPDFQDQFKELKQELENWLNAHDKSHQTTTHQTTTHQTTKSSTTEELKHQLEELMRQLQRGDYIDPNSLSGLIRSMPLHQELSKDLVEQISLFNTEKAIELVEKLSELCDSGMDNKNDAA